MSSFSQKTTNCKERWIEEAWDQGCEEKFRAVMLVIEDYTSVSEAARVVGVTRQTLHTWINKFMKEGISGLVAVKPGPKIDYEARYQEASIVNKELQKENRTLQRRLVTLEAIHVFFTTLLEVIFDIVSPKYMRFSAIQKWRIVEVMRNLKEHGISIKEFSHITGKCYNTLLRWYNLAKGKSKEEALHVLKDKSSGKPGRRISDKVLEAILNCHRQYPHWGAKQISGHLKRLSPSVQVAQGTVASLIKEFDPDWSPDKKRRRKIYSFGEKNFAACMDFVELSLSTFKVSLCVVMDESTRFITGWALSVSTSTKEVVELLKSSMETYGKVTAVKTDNGPEFRRSFREAVNEMGVYHLNSPCYYAKFNAKIERAFRELRWFLKFKPEAQNISQLEEQISEWVYEHNYLRLNEGIGCITPYEAFIEGKPIYLPSELELIDTSCQQGKLILKFTGRNYDPKHLELDLVA